MKTTETKTIEQVLSEGNSIANQNIKQLFVSKHVNTNVNQMVEYILRQYDYKNAPFTSNDIENFYIYLEYNGEFASFKGGNEEQRTEEIERLKDLQNGLKDLENKEERDIDFEIDNIEDKRTKIGEEIEELENLESEAQEVFEWWSVSSFLCRQLADMGHPVLKDENIWGRCTTGQAILLDYAITKICADMEILEGQSNSWANHK